MTKRTLGPSLRITILYILIATSWILLSDRLTEVIAVNPEDLSSLQTVKGIGYVIATALLLFLLFRKELARRDLIEQDLRQSQRAFQTLSACNQAMVRASDEAELLGEICRQITTIGKYKMAWIGIAEHNEEKIVKPVAWSGFEDGYLDTIRVTWADDEYGRGPTGTAIRNGKPSVMRHILTDPSFMPWREAALKRGYSSSAALPLHVDGNMLGALNVYSDKPDSFDAQEIALLMGLANDVGYGRHTLRTRTELESLLESSRELSGTLDSKEVLAIVAQRAVSLLAADECVLFQLENDRETLRPIFVRGDYVDETMATTLHVGEGLVGYCVAHCETILANHASQDPRGVRIAGTPDTEQEHLMVVPLLFRDEAIGAMLVRRISSRVFTEKDLLLLTGFAGHASTAIQNAHLYQELEEYSTILEQAVADAIEEVYRVKARLELILNNSPNAVLLLKPDGRIDTGNPAFYRLFEYSGDEVYDHSLTTLIAPSHRLQVERILQVVLQERRTEYLELTAQRQDGTTFDAEIVLAPVQEGPELTGMVCSIRNISAFKEVERMKDIFLSTAAHEMRTPLTSIRGFSEILLTRDLAEERRKNYLKTINEQAVQMTQILNDLLDIARFEARRQLEMERKPIDWTMLVKEVVQPFVDTSPDHRFELEFSESIPTVSGDPLRLTQVLRNLLSNAVKYSRQGGLVTVRSRIQEEHLEVSVADEGVGMTPEQQAHLFEKFYRAGTVDGVSGTGIGLVICKLIVEAHGGKIWAESKFGIGSTFLFTIPLTEAR